MFVNLHNLPAGTHLYTLAVTDAPYDTPKADLFYDEVDVIAPVSLSSASALARQMSEEDRACYAGQRIVGIVDQSQGRVIWENVNSVVVVPRTAR